MLRYFLRRLLQSVVVLFLFITALFFLIKIFMVGDVASFLAYGGGPELAAAYREFLGLDLPLSQQYLIWLGNVLGGSSVSYYTVSIYDPSWQGVPASEYVRQGLTASAINLGVGMVIAYCIGAWLGRVTAWRKGGLLSGAVTLFGIVLYTTFPPLLVWLIQELDHRIERLRLPITTPLPFLALLIFTLVVTMLILTIINRGVRSQRRWWLPGLIFAAAAIVMWFGGEWVAVGASPVFIDALRPFGMVCFVCVLLFFGETMLVMRTSMTDTLYEDYIFTARAKGLSEHVIRDEHAARNAMLPALSRLVVSLPYILTGLVIVEYLTEIRGLGTILFDSLGTYDIPVVMGCLSAIGILAIVARLILDLVVAVLDPRIRLALPETPQQGFERQKGGLLQMLRRRFLRQNTGDGLSHPAATKARTAPPKSSSEVLSAQLRQLRRRVRLAWEQARKSWGIFAENWLGLLGLVMIGVFALMAIAHPILMATVWPRNVYDPLIGFDPMVYPHPAPPSAAHLLGTDALGHDVLSMLLASTTPTFVVALTAAVISAVIGTLLGALSAYYQGRPIDRLFGYLADMFLTFPAPIAMIIISWRFYDSVTPFGFGLIYGVMAGGGSMTVVMRALAVKLMARPFIEASRAAGAGGGRIIFTHLIPHMLPLAAVQMVMTVAGAVVAYSFIGWLGIMGTRLNWGYIIYFAITYAVGFSGVAPLPQLLAPGLALSFFSAAFYLVSRGLHQVAEPRLRER